MSIQPLSPKVIAQIQSSVAITSLNDVVCELTKNALDAQCFKIKISVNYSQGSCTVEDDGHGILPAEFHDGGGLGKAYRKTHSGQNPKYLAKPHQILQSQRTGLITAFVVLLSLP